MSKANELKSLQVRADKLNQSIRLLDEDRKRISDEIGRKKTELNVVNQQINKFALGSPVVTEHALLRYIERVIGIDLDKITNDILTEQNIKAIEFAGNCKIKSSGVELIVKDRKVISVVT